MTLDQQLEFLDGELRNLRQRSERWAQDKVRKLEFVRETVRCARQDAQMTSAISGKRIGE